MPTGMLWFDNDPKRTLSVKIQRAMDYYQKKYGHAPDTALVHPSMLEKQEVMLENITVRPYRPVLPGHIWLGVENTEEKK